MLVHYKMQLFEILLHTLLVTPGQLAGKGVSGRSEEQDVFAMESHGQFVVLPAHTLYRAKRFV